MRITQQENSVEKRGYALTGRFFISEPLGKPLIVYIHMYVCVCVCVCV